MAATTVNQNSSSSNGSNSGKILYDEYQKKLSSQFQEEKKSKGKLRNFFGNICKSARNDASSSKKRDGAAAPAQAAIGSDGDVTQNNPGEGSSSQKREIPRTYQPPHAFRGFENDERSLEIMLLNGGRDDSFKTIGVVGLPGVGKTTLCTLILQNERVKSRYVPMLWISLSSENSKTYDEDTVKKTLEETGVTEKIIEYISDEQKLPGLLDTLNQHLKENKSLIVIDDVGEEEGDSYYENLKNHFDSGCPKDKGGAVIVTCRSEEAAKKMVGDNNLHRLQPLEDPKSCWLIYNDAVKDCKIDEHQTVSKDVMEELMKRCGGLPGAAQMMGQIKAEQIKKKPRGGGE